MTEYHTFVCISLKDCINILRCACNHSTWIVNITLKSFCCFVFVCYFINFFWMKSVSCAQFTLIHTFQWPFPYFAEILSKIDQFQFAYKILNFNTEVTFTLICNLFKDILKVIAFDFELIIWFQNHISLFNSSRKLNLYVNKYT